LQISKIVKSYLHHLTKTIEIMRAKSKKVVSETHFSEVDGELDDLHKFIMMHSDLQILENKHEAKAMPFPVIQDYIKSKGKRIWVDTLAIMLKT